MGNALPAEVKEVKNMYTTLGKILVNGAHPLNAMC